MSIQVEFTRFDLRKEEGGPKDPEARSSTNAQEGLQNVDELTRIDSTGAFKSRSVSPQVCRSQNPELRSFINALGSEQHAMTGPFRSRPV